MHITWLFSLRCHSRNLGERVDVFLYDYTIKSESNPATVSEVQVNDIGPAGSDKDAFPENAPPPESLFFTQSHDGRCFISHPFVLTILLELCFNCFTDVCSQGEIDFYLKKPPLLISSLQAK